MRKVLVIGGGAAGMMAAVTAAKNGGQVLFSRKMKSLGRRFLSQEKDGATLQMQRI